jgi:hypothetical protein
MCAFTRLPCHCQLTLIIKTVIISIVSLLIIIRLTPVVLWLTTENWRSALFFSSL